GSSLSLDVRRRWRLCSYELKIWEGSIQGARQVSTVLTAQAPASRGKDNPCLLNWKVAASRMEHSRWESRQKSVPGESYSSQVADRVEPTGQVLRNTAWRRGPGLPITAVDRGGRKSFKGA
ncbi:MAG: hypothetical protein AAGU11_05590, partial [Syntrophobacteraceae bacterium]